MSAVPPDAPKVPGTLQPAPIQKPSSWRRLAAHWRWLLLVLPILALAIWFGPALLLGPILPAETVTRGTLLRSVVATGRVTTPLRVAIGSQITGTVAVIPVIEGQRVTAGQLGPEAE